MTRPAARRDSFYWSSLRSPAINNWDMAIIKNTYAYKERVTVQFRCEMLNAFNRVWFGALDTNPLSATDAWQHGGRVKAVIAGRDKVISGTLRSWKISSGGTASSHCHRRHA